MYRLVFVFMETVGKMETVGTCTQPIWDFGSHFRLARLNSFKKVSTSQIELLEMENASQIGLKAQKRCIKKYQKKIVGTFFKILKPNISPSYDMMMSTTLKDTQR